MNLKTNRFFSVVLKIFLTGLGAVMTALAIACFSLIILLSRGPLNLTPHKTYAEKTLQYYFPNFQLEFEAAFLGWNQQNWSFVLRANKSQAFSEKNKYKIEGLQITWPLSRLFILNFSPTEILLNKPKIKITESEDENEEEDQSAEISGLESIQSLIRHSSLEKIIIANASLSIASVHYGEWSLTQANMVFKNKGDEIEGAFSVDVENLGRLTGTLVTRENKPRKLQVALKDFNLKTILTHANFQEIPALEKYNPCLSGVNVPFTGVITLYLNDELAVEGFKFNLDAGQGNFVVDPYFPKAIPLRSALFKGECRDNKLQIKTIQMESPLFSTTLEGVIGFYPTLLTPETITFKLKNLATKLKFEDAPLLWYKEAAPVIRQWIISNIPHGNVVKSVTEFEGAYKTASKDLEVTKLSGILLPQSAALKYLEGMPLIENIDAEVAYDKDAMSIDLKNGHTFSQKIKTGKIIISDLQKEDQFIDIDLSLEGLAGDALKIINAPRLKYADEYGLAPSSIKGNSQTHLRFKFPLQLNTTFKQIDFSVSSKLTDITIPHVTKTPDITLSKANLELELTKKEMTLQGKGLLNNSESKILLKEKFENNKDWAMKLSIASQFSDQQLKQMGFPVSDYFKGTAPFTLDLTQYNNKEENLKASFNFKGATLTIPEFRIKTEPSKAHTLYLDMSMKKGRPQKIKKLKLNMGQALQFESSADFIGDSGKLKSFLINEFKTAQDSYQGEITLTPQGSYRVSLAGTYIDLNSFIENRDELEESFLSKMAYSADIKFQKAQIKGKPFLKNMAAELNQTSKGYVENLRLSAELDNASKKRKTCVFNIATNNNQQTLSLKMEDLGTALSALSMGSDLRGGITEINAQRPLTTPLSAWEGTFRVKDFQIIKAPLMAQLLKIASPLSFIDIFTKGKGLKFSELRGGFSLKPDVILVKKSLATGPSIGMTLEGAINRKQETLNLRGTIIPAYILNTMLSYIPIIGQILAGGAGEGVFAISFTMKGPQSNPQIQANPLSALTPGVLRKIFETETLDK